MKYLKIYDKFTSEKLKEGDIVVCIDETKTSKVDGINYGRKYKINTIESYLITLKRMNNSIVKDNFTEKPKKYFINNFLLENEFEVWLAAKKYNL